MRFQTNYWYEVRPPHGTPVVFLLESQPDEKMIDQVMARLAYTRAVRIDGDKKSYRRGGTYRFNRKDAQVFEETYVAEITVVPGSEEIIVVPLDDDIED